MSEHKVTVYKDDAGEWRWTRQAGNGETVSSSSEGYVDLGHAKDMAVTINPGVEVHVQRHH